MARPETTHRGPVPGPARLQGLRWLQQEGAEDVNRLLVDWLQSLLSHAQRPRTRLGETTSGRLRIETNRGSPRQPSHSSVPMRPSNGASPNHA